jgi:hypothetical protein
MKPLPAKYADLRSAFPLSEVSIGYSGVALEANADVPAAQKGYSIIPAGQTTDWKEPWLVVGHETSLGDPVFIDTGEERIPVYTAPHGEGTWSPELIAPSVDLFFAIIRRLAGIAKGRENPVAMEKNPISNAEIAEFRSFLAGVFDGDVPLFWMLLVDPPKE